MPQAIFRIGFDKDAEVEIKACRCHGADDDRRIGIRQSVRLDHDGRARLPVVAGDGNGDDVASFHSCRVPPGSSSFQSATLSIHSRISRSYSGPRRAIGAASRAWALGLFSSRSCSRISGEITVEDGDPCVVCFLTVGIQYLQRWPVPPVESCACPRGNSTGGCLLIIFPLAQNTA